MFRKLLSKRSWLTAAVAGAFLPATIVCDIPSFDIVVDGWDDDEVVIDHCCWGDGFYFDWWWF
ncbi:MAG: hypothetical protein HZB38_13865 [Planctomycetes bacterium]|nr:hypothetical protein [Planctomycetota bacterium]